MSHATAEVEYLGRAGSITIDFVPLGGNRAGRLRERHPGPDGLDAPRVMRAAVPETPVPDAGPGKWSPACLDAAEWATWQRLNPKAHSSRGPITGRTVLLRDYADRPCQDCPASYARMMRAVGKCNGEAGMVE